MEVEPSGERLVCFVVVVCATVRSYLSGVKVRNSREDEAETVAGEIDIGLRFICRIHRLQTTASDVRKWK